MTGGVRNVTAPGGHLGGRCVTVTYHGSITQAHGTAWLVDDCDCPACIRLDPWDPARCYLLRVEVEHPGTPPHRETRRLTHVHEQSIAEACPTHSHPPPRTPAQPLQDQTSQEVAR